jgi:hypothetical protein
VVEVSAAYEDFAVVWAHEADDVLEEDAFAGA